MKPPAEFRTKQKMARDSTHHQRGGPLRSLALAFAVASAHAVGTDYAPQLRTAGKAARAAGEIMTRKLGAEVLKTKFNPKDLLTAGPYRAAFEGPRLSSAPVP